MVALMVCKSENSKLDGMEGIRSCSSSGKINKLSVANQGLLCYSVEQKEFSKTTVGHWDESFFVRFNAYHQKVSLASSPLNIGIE